MSAGQNTQTGKSGDSGRLGVGGPTSGEQGSSLTHETMAETGGSGGIQQTKPNDEEVAGTDYDARQTAQPGSGQGGSEAGKQTGGQPEGAGTAATAVGRGAQDTRSQQAGISSTGLGTPETGANQSEEDLPPPRRE
jgi:hypothetical protein